ncbi:MAG: lamin tail domain-containing protein [Sandaracinaceae bacterium]|nr:lamin tail domain-containing protein [Sandaracinaceae bacterium]
MKKTTLSILALLALAACDPPRNRSDAGTPLDAFVVRNDAYVPPGTDAGTMTDAYVLPMMTDAYVPPMTDAARPDAFVAMADAYSVDAYVPRDAPFASTPCEQIAAVRATSGALSPAYPVTGAVVSYVMPVLPTGATDPRGVFVQCPGSAGPALFLAISPDDTTAFSTPPTVGQVVSFSVTGTADTTTSGGTGDQHRVTSITGWSVTGSGSIASEGVSAVAVPSMIDTYESELISLDAVIASSATAAGMGFTSFQITTPGVTTASTDFRLRMTTDVAASLGLVAGCTVHVEGTPLWRFTTAAQPSVWRASEITVGSCPSACTPASHLVINEMDYDQMGADTAEFVELHNPTASAIDLTGHVLVAVNGLAAGAVEYSRVTLSGSLAAGGYLLVTATGSTVPGATLTFPDTLQNGPDGFLLLGPGNTVVDAAMYEGVIASVTLTGGTVISVSESASVGTDPATADQGLGRTPNGCDRDTPGADWSVRTITPGAAN